MRSFYQKFIPMLFFLAILFLLLRFPTLTLIYAKKGLSIWYQSMVPALFPMMIVTGCMIKLNLTSSLVSIFYPFTKKIYPISKHGTYAFVMGFLCGFPMGAKIITELYQNHKLSKEEANALLPICNNIGPIFLLTYGLKGFVNQHTYLILFLFYGIILFYAFFLLHGKHFNHHAPSLVSKLSFSVSLDESITEGASSILSLGGYLMFFSILSMIPRQLLHLSPKTYAFTSCLIEITNGLSVSECLPPYVILFLLQFGGLCCIFQTIKYISKTDLSFFHYLKHKCILSLITLLLFYGIDFFFSASFFV